MRKIFAAAGACLIAAMVLFTGCGIQETVQIKSDLSAKTTTRVYYTKDEADDLKELDEGNTLSFTKAKVGGKTFYYDKSADDVSKTSAKKTKKDYISLTKSKMEASILVDEDDMAIGEELAGTEDLSDEDIMELFDFATVKITFPKKVVKANGKISKDGKTVTYDLLKLTKKGTSRAYAALDQKAATSKKISISGVKNKGVYKSAKTVKISSPGVIQWVKVNGKYIDANQYKASKKGKYTVTVKLLSGAKKTVKFTIKK